SGKTTLLQLLGALDRPSAGEIVFEGRDLSSLRDRELAELRLRSFGFVFQQFNLIPTLTAAENVEVKLAPVGGNRRRALELLDEVGLAARAEHLPRTCPAASSSASRSRAPCRSSRWPSTAPPSPSPRTTPSSQRGRRGAR